MLNYKELEEKRYEKKLLAAVLAASMALTMAPVLPVNTGTVASAEDVNETVGPEVAFWTAFSKPYELEQDGVLTLEFDNKGGTELYHNYVLVFTNDGTTPAAATAPAEHKEFAVVRADNWGWGGGQDNKSLSGQDIIREISYDLGDAEGFKEIMKDAHVKMDITRKGQWVKVSAKVTSNTDETKSYDYNVSVHLGDTDKAFVNFTLENATVTIKSIERSDADPDLVIGPDIDVPGTNDPGTNDPGTNDPGEDDPGEDDPGEDDPAPAKTKIKINKVTAKKNATKVTGTVSVAKATAKVKVGKKAYKKATVNGKKFTIKVAKLKKGTKVTVKATKKNCTAGTKSVTVK